MSDSLFSETDFTIDSNAYSIGFGGSNCVEETSNHKIFIIIFILSHCIWSSFLNSAPTWLRQFVIS